EDVTQRRKEEEQEQIAKLKLMVENAPQIAMALFDPEGRVVQASASYFAMIERMLGLAEPEVRARRWADLWFGDPQDAQALERVLHSGEPLQLREVRVGGGQESVWDCSLIPITSDAAGGRYVLLSGVEITDAVTSRDRLQEVDHLKDEFLSLASHELRT